MKKKFSAFLVFVLILSFALSGSALADGMSVSVNGGGTGVIGQNVITLTAATSSTAADIEYLWYSTGYNDIATISSVGVTSASFTPPQTSGTVYYCVSASSLSEGTSGFSGLVAVTYNNGTQGLKINRKPDKWQYYVGDTVNLTGLSVEITTASGTWTANDGADVSVSPRVLTVEGEAIVTVSYDGYSASFPVSVAPHVHAYSAWKVTKAASCTTTGTRTRTCSCGATQTDTIAKTDHSWNNGTVANGIKTYTCTVCGTTKTEKVAASPSPSPTATPKPTTTPKPSATPVAGVNGTTNGTNGGVGTVDGTGLGSIPGVSGTSGGAAATPVMPTTPGSTVGANGTNNGTNNEQASTGFKWWIIPLVAAAVGVVAGGGAYMYLTFVKKQ